MKEFRFKVIEDFVARYEALPDAAFLAAMAEQGVDADEIEKYAKAKEKRERALRAVRRK